MPDRDYKIDIDTALDRAMLCADFETVKDVIAQIEQRPEFVMPFTEDRYPYTYAYDYLRTHWEQFGLERWLSRGECAALFRGPDGELREDKEQICELLADAYLRQWHIERPL